MKGWEQEWWWTSLSLPVSCYVHMLIFSAWLILHLTTYTHTVVRKHPQLLVICEYTVSFTVTLWIFCKWYILTSMLFISTKQKPREVLVTLSLISRMSLTLSAHTLATACLTWRSQGSESLVYKCTWTPNWLEPSFTFLCT